MNTLNSLSNKSGAKHIGLSDLWCRIRDLKIGSSGTAVSNLHVVRRWQTPEQYDFTVSRQKARTIAAPNTQATMVAAKAPSRCLGRERAEKRDVEDGRRDQPGAGRELHKWRRSRET